MKVKILMKNNSKILLNPILISRKVYTRLVSCTKPTGLQQTNNEMRKLGHDQGL